MALDRLTSGEDNGSLFGEECAVVGTRVCVTKEVRVVARIVH